MVSKKYDLEDRFVDYTCRMIDLVEALPLTRAGNYFAGQLIRSCHSPAFNYGEAKGVESRNDFIHKMGKYSQGVKRMQNSPKNHQKKAAYKASFKTWPYL